MDATFMHLLTRLRTDHPQLRFVLSNGFRWSPEVKTIFIAKDLAHAEAFCLHELSHAILGHNKYERDIGLLRLERDAWEYAKDRLAKFYEVPISDELIQDSLNTYREWLHARSLCPSCAATGIQTNMASYHCIACDQTWRVNEARMCGLKRYKQQQISAQ
jgi:IrrE N-terminal-like domain